MVLPDAWVSVDETVFVTTAVTEGGVGVIVFESVNEREFVNKYDRVVDRVLSTEDVDVCDELMDVIEWETDGLTDVESEEVTVWADRIDTEFDVVWDNVGDGKTEVVGDREMEGDVVLEQLFDIDDVNDTVNVG
jgi:hypothetical protein